MKNVITILTTTCLLFGGIEVHGSDLTDCKGTGVFKKWHNCFGTYTPKFGTKYVGDYLKSRIMGY